MENYKSNDLKFSDIKVNDFYVEGSINLPLEEGTHKSLEKAISFFYHLVSQVNG
jgi:hypothetical protein